MVIIVVPVVFAVVAVAGFSVVNFFVGIVDVEGGFLVVVAGAFVLGTVVAFDVSAGLTVVVAVGSVATLTPLWVSVVSRLCTSYDCTDVTT